MIAHQIGVVICRVAAAILAVQAIRAIGFALPAMFADPETILSSLLPVTVLGFFPGLVAVALWLFAERIVGVPKDEAPSPGTVSIDETELVRAGTLLIGVYLLVTGAILGLSVEITDLMAPELPELEHANRRYEVQRIATRITYVLEMLFGISLIVGRRRLARFATKLRRTGADT